MKKSVHDRLTHSSLQYQRQTDRGFLLVEVAIAVVIVVLLLGGIGIAIVRQLEERQQTENRLYMQQIQEALLGFAAAHGRLPCPDTKATPDGLESRANVVSPATSADGCTGGSSGSVAARTRAFEGTLPWATLGVTQSDAWGRLIRYRVMNEFTRPTLDPTANLAPCINTTFPSPENPNFCTLELTDSDTTNQLRISTRNALNKATPAIVAEGIGVIALSFGRNGRGARTADGNVLPAAPGGTDEAANANAAGGNQRFITRPATELQSVCNDAGAGSAFCEFDDHVVWLPTYLLFERLVRAGRLP